MFLKVKEKLEQIIGQISAASQSRALTVTFVGASVLLLGLVFVKNNIGINTDTENMLSEKLPWRTTYIEFKKSFPFFADTIVVVTDGDTPDIAEDVARELASSLAEDGSYFESVLHLSEHPYFRQNQLLYVSPDELSKLSDSISRSQALLSRLANEPTATRLMETVAEALDYGDTQSAANLDQVLTKISQTVRDSTNNNFRPMSWQNILSATPTDQSAVASKSEKLNLENRVIFIAKPVMDFSAILPAENAIKKLRTEITKLESKYNGGVRIRLTGGAALAHDEMSSVIAGSMKAGVLSLILVVVCLFVGLRSWVLVLSTLFTLMIGLTLTAAFAVAAVGALNMISIAFAVLYLGLGVDFAIHICLRYKELHQGNPTNQLKNELITWATKHVGASIALCALTTAIGFFAFIPTDYKGVAELGLIAGVGMFISLITSIVLLPAFLQLLPPLKTYPEVVRNSNPLNLVTPRNAKTILVIAGCLWFMTSISVSFVSFDIDPINLNQQSAESVELLKELSKNGDNSTHAVSMLAKDEKELAEIEEKLSKVVSIGSVTTLNSLIPTDQQEKFPLIDDLALILGGELSLNQSAELDSVALLLAIKGLNAKLRQLPTTEQTAENKLLLASLTQFLQSLESLSNEQATAKLKLLNNNLMSSFHGRIARLNDALSPSDVTQENLPKELRERWISNEGIYRIEALPREALASNHALRAFVGDVQRAVGANATGAAIINVSAADAVQTAFIQAFCYALALISVLLWIILRSFKEVVVTLFPLLLAGLIACSVIVLAGFKFNFANVIALPLLLGIGVDSALHLLHRYKTDLPKTAGLLQTSTARAVLFSAATTTVSFGTLAASSHAGTASMGIVLSAGIVALLFCMLIILPAMLLMFVEQGDRSSQS